MFLKQVVSTCSNVVTCAKLRILLAAGTLPVNWSALPLRTINMTHNQLIGAFGG